MYVVCVCVCMNRYGFLFFWFNKMEGNSNNWERLCNKMRVKIELLYVIYEKCLSSGILIREGRKCIYDFLRYDYVRM